MKGIGFITLLLMILCFGVLLHEALTPDRFYVGFYWHNHNGDSGYGSAIIKANCFDCKKFSYEICNKNGYNDIVILCVEKTK